MEMLPFAAIHLFWVKLQIVMVGIDSNYIMLGHDRASSSSSSSVLSVPFVPKKSTTGGKERDRAE
jgi:hypothetical protein